MAMPCSHCGAEIPAGSRFCPECGRPVVREDSNAEVPRLCPQCGSPVAEGSRFCATCGQPVPLVGRATAPFPPVEPPPAPDRRLPPPPLPARKRGGGAIWGPVLIGVLAALLVVGVGGLVLVPDLRAALMSVVGRGDGTADAPAAAATAAGLTVVPSATDPASPTGVAAVVTPPAEAATAEPTASPTPIPASPTPPAATSTPAVAATAAATAAPAATATEPPTTAPSATATAVAVVTESPAATAAPPSPGVVLSFEQDRDWRRGDEPHGEFTRSNERAKSGAYAGRLAYQFPAADNNYVVFLARPAIALGGRPTGLTAWVYGDASGHFLNAWVQDAAGEVRQYTFGRIDHQGWGQMTAWFDDARGWPNVSISGSDNGGLDHPTSLYALLVDGVPDGQASSGVIYLDDVATTSAAIVAEATAAPAEPTAAPDAPTPAPAPQGPVEVIFEYGWDGGWMGVENRGVWAATGDGRQYVAEVGFLSSPQAIEALKGVPDAGWKGKIVVRKQVGWVSCTTEVCQEHTADGTQGLITNEIYLRPEAWTSLVNAHLSGGWAAVVANPFYAEVQEKALDPIGDVPSMPVIGLRFTRME